MHLNYPSPNPRVDTDRAIHDNIFLDGSPRKYWFISVTADESVMQTLAAGQSREVFMFLV